MRDSIRSRRAAGVIAVGACMALARVALAGPIEIDPAIKPYAKVSGVSGNLNSIGSDTLNNVMTLWAEGFQKVYPNVKIQIEGKGSSTAPPALIASTAQLGPMSREMKPSEIDDFEKKFGYKPTKIRVAIDALAVYRQQGQSAQAAHPAAGRRDLLEGPRLRRAKEITTWGELGLSGCMGGEADQPLRPQLGLRHLRLLQGARAVQRRLQGHGQGAAGLGLGGAGRGRGPVRHRLQRHRLQDLGREDAGAGAQGRRRPSSRPTPSTSTPASIRCPASSTSTSTRRPTSRSTRWSASSSSTCSAARASRSWSRTATCR